jgi:hypothetical protein
VIAEPVIAAMNRCATKNQGQKPSLSPICKAVLKTSQLPQRRSAMPPNIN